MSNPNDPREVFGEAGPLTPVQGWLYRGFILEYDYRYDVYWVTSLHSNDCAKGMTLQECVDLIDYLYEKGATFLPDDELSPWEQEEMDDDE